MNPAPTPVFLFAKSSFDASAAGESIPLSFSATKPSVDAEVSLDGAEAVPVKLHLATGAIFRSGPEARSLRDYFVKAIQMFYTEGEITELLAHVGFRRVSRQAAHGGVMAIHRAHKD